MPVDFRLAGVLAIVVILAPVSAHAQRVPADTVTLALALERVSNSPVVNRERYAEEIATATLNATRTEGGLQLNLVGGGGQQYGLAFDQTSGTLTREAIEAADLYAGVALPVLVPGRRASLRAASYAVEAARLSQGNAMTVGRRRVVELFRAHANAENAWEASVEAVRSLDTLAALVTQRAQVGLTSSADPLRVRVELALAQGAEREARASMDEAHARLAFELGLEPDRLITFVSSNPSTLDSEAANSPTQAQVFRAQATAADARASATQQQWLPTVALSLGGGVRVTSALDIPLTSQAYQNSNGGLALRVSFSPFDRRSARSRASIDGVRASALRSEAEEAEREDADRMARARARAEAATQTPEALRPAAEFARDAYAIEESRYALGTGSVDALLAARQLVRTAEAAIRRADLDVRYSAVELALGGF